MTDMLLTTKLHIPIPVQGLVNRPHLLQQLDQGKDRGITLLCAAAGSGKSTLLSQWIAERQLAEWVAWVSLDESDNSLDRFLSYITASLHRVDDRLGNTTDAMLQSPQNLPYEALLTPLINEIAALSTPIHLILDDYHLIHELIIHDAMTFFIKHKPPQLHMIIATRHDPPFSLGQMRVRGKIGEIRGVDLGFSHEEIAEFFKMVAATDLNPYEIDLLGQRTEGWIAGLQLAGLALQGRNDVSNFIDDFAGDHTYIVDYLGAEVFKRQPEAIRDFLLKTAILPRLNASLCNAVAERDNAQDILEHLRQANLFLIPLDNRREWYRYHHLFSDLLFHFLQQTYPEQIPRLHIRASEWFWKHGFVSDAIHHALAAADYQRAADIIEQVGLRLVGEGRLSTLRNWIMDIPDKMISQRPYLSVFMAWGNVLIGDPTSASKHLAMAQEGLQQLPPLPDSTHLEIRCQIELLRAYIARSGGDLITSIHQIETALNHVPENNAFLDCTLHLNLGGNYWLAGDFLSAEPQLLQASRFVEDSHAGYPALSASGFLANIFLHTARLTQADQFCQKIIQTELAQRRFPLPAIAYVYMEQGELLYERHELEAATEALENTIRLGENVDRVVNIERAMQLLALIKLWQGDKAAAYRYIEGASALFKASATRYPVTRHIEFSYYQMRIWLVCGDTDAAAQWANDYQAPQSIRNIWDGMNLLSFARALFVTRQYEKALAKVTHCIKTGTDYGVTGWVIQGLILKALCWKALRDEDKALNSLSETLSIAEPQGYIRSFVDAGNEMGKLLSSLITREKARSEFSFSTGYVTQLLAIINEESPLDSALHEQLTDRELEVLRLLAAEFSNKDIAEKLFISLGTVKQYNHIIYRKLDVNTRKEAVQRAIDLNLL